MDRIARELDASPTPRLDGVDYINDLPYSVTCNSNLFADHTVLHRFIENRSDCDLLQEDLSSASEWCKSWLVTLKTEKCEVLHIAQKKDPIRCQYPLNNILDR